MKAVAKGLGIGVGLLLALILTFVIFGAPVAKSLQLVAEGAFGSNAGVARTLVKATPLLICGLGMTLAWRAGVYNIGGEGQFIIGGLAGAWLAANFIAAPPALLNLAILAASVAGGALYGGLAGWLQVSRGVQAVVSTILLNFVAIQLLAWATNGPLRDVPRGLPLTVQLPDAAMLMRFDPQTDLHAGVFVALGAACALYVWLYYTRAGFRLRLVGESPRAARSAWIDPGRWQVAGMLLSGGLCGLAGGVEYTGTLGSLGASFPQGWGFLAIPVALLGGLHPLGVILSSLYFGALLAGSENLARFTPAGATMIYVIQGLAVLGFVCLSVLPTLKRRKAEASA